jgi:tetratricopeptide (TPR) repeat protein
MTNFLYIGWDLLAVYLVSGLPLAASLAGLLRRRFPMTGALGFALAVQLSVLIVVPWIYRQARCRHDLQQLQGLLEQSRFGEAQLVSEAVLRLNNRVTLNGVPLRRVAADIDQTVQVLQSRTAFPLPAEADDPTRIARAQDLAMLGQTDAALAVLDFAAALNNSPAALNLRGTIHETRREWRLAREWYSRAKLAWQSHDASPEKTAGLIQAATGIGFAERKLGRYQQAEAAYQEVLSLAPTADSHFLLAQFYEDTQQAAKAQFHARAAMALVPERFTQPGQQLIDKLITLHFGCWGVRSAEQRTASSANEGQR